MKLAVIFNGQGAQYEGMGMDFVRDYPQAREIIEKVEDLTDYPITKWIEEDICALSLTRNAQVAIGAVSQAIYASIKDQLPEVEYMAGLSLGEYSALIASGMLDMKTGFELLKKRGQIMSDECQKISENQDLQMLAVLGAPLEVIQELVEQVNQDGEEKLFISNLNSTSQTVIAGRKDAAKEFRKLAKEAGYKKAIPLKVEGPFHSPFMKGVREPFGEYLDGVEFSEASIPVISNTSLEIHTPEKVKGLLVDHMTEPVRWEETIRFLADQGVSHLIQIGPGETLANLLKREENVPAVLAVDKVEDVLKIKEFLGG